MINNNNLACAEGEVIQVKCDQKNNYPAEEVFPVSINSLCKYVIYVSLPHVGVSCVAL